MKNRKEFSVVMLPTEKAHEIGDIVTNKVHGLIIYDKIHKENEPLPLEYQNQKSQFLYFTSDDIIEEGEWGIPKCANEAFNKKAIKFVRVSPEAIGCIYVTDGVEEYHTTALVFKNARKIISSSDKTITPNSWIPESFVKAYVKTNYEGQHISTVSLEMIDKGFEGWLGSDADGEPFWNEILKLKTRPDGSVIIHQNKLYSGVEVVKILSDYREHAWKNGIAIQDFNKWVIDKNL